jgi:diacylglycerol kinase family enzyme
VLLINPHSGGGKAERFGLAQECRARGIEPVVLRPGEDVVALAEDAVASGAEVIGMAGGDGSLALVAGVAARHRVPMVVVPAGTRNHLAMDLGVDRGDVVGALDAYGAAVERAVDLGMSMAGRSSTTSRSGCTPRSSARRRTAMPRWTPPSARCPVSWGRAAGRSI